MNDNIPPKTVKHKILADIGFAIGWIGGFFYGLFKIKPKGDKQ